MPVSGHLGAHAVAVVRSLRAARTVRAASATDQRGAGETVGNPMGNPMGNPWEIHGKTHGKTRKPGENPEESRKSWENWEN